MPTIGRGPGFFTSSPDYRELVGRLDFGRTMAREVTFSPDECWVLREYIRHLDGDVNALASSGGTLNERSDEG